MKLTYCVLAAVITNLCTMISVSAETEVDFIADALPGTILISADLDSFETTEASGRIEEASMVSAAPNFRLGLGLDMEDVYVDITGGGGIILNSRFRSVFLDAQLGVSWNFSSNGHIGPHIGVVHYLEPSWYGDADVDFESDTGYLAGLQMVIGHEVSFYFSMDYITGEPDVTPETRGNASADSLELSGILLQFGVRGTF